MNRSFIPRSLFSQTSLTLSIALSLFMVLGIGITLHFILIPVAERSTEDLAALMILTTQTWSELPPSTRPDFEHELQKTHQLIVKKIDPDNTSLLQGTSLPYANLVHKALENRLGRKIPTGTLPNINGWYWFDIPVGRHLLRTGFSNKRLVSQAPLAAIILIMLGTLFIIVTSTLLVRRINRPLKELVIAVEQIGQGHFPSPLPEYGPDEIRKLAAGLNQMVLEVKQLIANRTILLAGISHDIRTPLTHMALTLEMLPSDVDQELYRQMEKDLEEMNHLIETVVEFSRDLETPERDQIDIQNMLRELVSEERFSNVSVHSANREACQLTISVISLRRILTNLLDNAIRYSGHLPVEIDLYCNREKVCITVIDRGPGIPNHYKEVIFQPFYRIESSRSRQTGGSGLGLAIVRQLSDANGWKVNINDNPKGGTRISLEIPLSDAPLQDQK